MPKEIKVKISIDVFKKLAKFTKDALNKKWLKINFSPVSIESWAERCRY